MRVTYCCGHGTRCVRRTPSWTAFSPTCNETYRYRSSASGNGAARRVIRRYSAAMTRREEALEDLGGAVYDFLWVVDCTWPGAGEPGPHRLEEDDLAFTAE